MPDFRIRGESTVQWEVVIEAEDGDSAVDMAKGLMEDAMTVELDMGPEAAAEITGQQDRILRVQEVSGAKPS